MGKMKDLAIDKMNDDYQKELEAIAELGYQAFLDGKRSSECPYKVLPLKQAWEEGYMDASMANEPFDDFDYEPIGIIDMAPDLDFWSDEEDTCIC